MKVTKNKLRRLIREQTQVVLNEYGNAAPPRDSNWRGFADALDIGVLDLDEIGYALGFQDFYDMDSSITPARLAQRDPGSFITAVRDNALGADGLQDREIMRIATSPSHLLDRASLVRRTTY